jgi:hypothetical protein
MVRWGSLSAAALALVLAACDHTQAFDPAAAGSQDEILAAPVEAATPALRQAGGIPFGMTAQPAKEYGDLYSGGKMTMTPGSMLSKLSAVRSRGGRVADMLAGKPRYYKEGGRFSLSKWKARVDRFKRTKFASYIDDGTIIGHYMIDEPNDKANWNGTTVSQSTLDEMARYSKRLWPKMATIVRVHPSYFKSSPRHVDAAWAQYLSRRGSVKDYIRQSVADAQRRGLALIVGLNVVHGGTPNKTRMTPSQVASYGSTLLSSSYPCAFVSWKYGDSYLSSSGIRSAMKTLRQKAEGRSRKSCRS